MYFGVGLVKTQEDFGVQGEPPAPRAARLAGDRVRAHRLGRPRAAAADRHVVRAMAVVGDVSGAARARPGEPAARARPALPHARGDDPRHRARRQRPDQRRDRRPGACPYQPAGLWEEMAFGDGYLAQSAEQSRGKDLYRRGIYTFWKRTVPPASLATFDAPDREKCGAPRAHEHAAPGPRAPGTIPPTSRRRAPWRSGRSPSRAPTTSSASRARSASPPRACRPARRSACSASCCSVSARRSRATAGPLPALSASANRRATSGVDPSELAAWTMVTSAILNLDETITRQ